MARYHIGIKTVFNQYRTLVYLCIVSVLAELAFAIMNQSAIPPYLELINLKSHAGVIIGAFLIVEALLKSPMGALGDRFGRRSLIMGGAIISCFTSLCMTSARSISFIIPLRMLDGVAAAAIWPTIFAAVSGSVPVDRRTMAMNLITVTYIVGIAFGPLCGGLINDYTGSKLASFFLISLLFFIIAILSYLLIPQRSQEDEEHKDEMQQGFRFRDVLLGLRAIPDMMAIAFIAFFGVGLLIPVVKYFAMDELKLSETGYGMLVLPVAAAVAAASLFVAYIGNKWSKAKSVDIGIAMCAISLWLMILSKHVWQFAACSMILGVGFVIAMPSWLALISDMSAPAIRGAVIGALGTAQGIGAWFGTNLGSYLYEGITISRRLGPHFTPFFFTAAALTISLALAIVYVRDGDGRRIVLMP